MPAFKDLTNKKFGRLLVLSRASNCQLGKTRYNVVCDCGTNKVVKSYNLVNGDSQSCGCLQKERVSEMGLKRFKDLSNQKFGKLLVINRAPNRKSQKSMWNTICDCETTIIVSGSNLISGHTRSCGCFKIERIKKTNSGKFRTAKGESGFNVLFHEYKRSAKRREKLFNLTKEEFRIFTKQACNYCASQPSNGKRTVPTIGEVAEKHKEYIYNGLDRIDNTKGYTVDNVVPCCRICNTSKGSLPLEEWYSWLNKVINKYNEKCS